MTDAEMDELAEQVWSAKTPTQRQSLDSGDWWEGFTDALKAVASDNQAPHD